MKNSNKNKAYFLYVVFQNIYIYIYWKTISLLQCITLIALSLLLFPLLFLFLLTPSLLLCLVSSFPQISPYLSLFSLFSWFPFPSVTQFSEFWAIFSFFSKQFLARWIPIWTTAEIHSFLHIKVQQKRKEKKKEKKNEQSKRRKFANIMQYG